MLRTRGADWLEPKLEAVLARLCQRLGPLMKTNAVKLPYLVDVVSTHALGRRITEATHQTWDHGVVAREVYVFITHGKGGRRFAVEAHSYSEGGQLIRLQGDPPSILTPEEEEVVDYVAELYGHLSPTSLGYLTKSLNPEVGEEAWGSNQEPDVSEDAYAHLSASWQTLWNELPVLNLGDESQWGELIEDADEYVAKALGG
jgi:uncharacterized phage-associated protein